jgi:glutaredoxin-related protein
MKMILDIPEVKSNFFQELLNDFDYVNVIKTIKNRQKEQQIADLADAFNDVKLHEQGKKKLKTAKEFFDEL